jgi:hypothetical protein
VRGLGDGTHLWHAEIVLRVPEVDSDANQERLLMALAEQIKPLDVVDPPGGRDLEAAWSYDIQPPSPDAGVGVACWVLADSVGSAADTAWLAVESAAEGLTARATLWDLRLIPRDAILSVPGGGTPLTLSPLADSEDRSSAP